MYVLTPLSLLTEYPHLTDGPEVKPSNLTVYTGLGQQFILSCTVSAWPRASLVWSKQHRQVRDSPRLTTRLRGDTHYLFVYNVTDADFGEYTCQARNRLGVTQQSILVVGERHNIARVVRSQVCVQVPLLPPP